MYDLTRFVERIKKAKIIHFEYISKTRIKTRWMQRNCFSSSPSSPSFPGNNKSYVTRASRIRLTFVCIEHRRGGIFEQKTLERSGWSAERYANVTRSSDDPRDTLERIIGPSDHCFLSRGGPEPISRESSPSSSAVENCSTDWRGKIWDTLLYLKSFRNSLNINVIH